MKTFAEFLREDQESTTEQVAPIPVTVSRTEPSSTTTGRTSDAPTDAAVKMKNFLEFVEES